MSTSSLSTSSRTRSGMPARIALRRACVRQVAQACGGRHAGRHRLQRVVVADLLELEPAAPRHTQRVGQQVGRIDIGQPLALAQVPLGIALQREAALGDRLAHAHGRDHVLQRLARARMHVHVAGGHQRHAGALAPASCSVASHRSSSSRCGRFTASQRLSPNRPAACAACRTGRPDPGPGRGTRGGTNSTSQPCSSAQVAVVPAHAVLALGRRSCARR